MAVKDPPGDSVIVPRVVRVISMEMVGAADTEGEPEAVPQKEGLGDNETRGEMVAKEAVLLGVMDGKGKTETDTMVEPEELSEGLALKEGLESGVVVEEVEWESVTLALATTEGVPLTEVDAPGLEEAKGEGDIASEGALDTVMVGALLSLPEVD